MNIFKNLCLNNKKNVDHWDLDSSLTLMGLSKSQRKWVITSENARQIGNIDEAHHCIVKALEEISDDETQWRIKAACLVNRGIFETQFGKYDQSETTFKSSLDLYNENNATEYEKCACLMEMGVVQLAQGELHLAETTFLKAKKYFETADDTSTKAIFFQNLAGLYESTARLSKAWFYAKQSLEIFSKVTCDPKQHVGCLILMGNLCRNSNKINEAETAYHDAINLLSTTQNPYPELARCWLGVGNVYMEQQKFEEAIQEIQKAIEYLESNKGNPFDLAIAKMNLGVTRIYLEQFIEAIPHLEYAFRIFQKLPGEISYTTVCESNLGMAYCGKGDLIKGAYLLNKAIRAYERQPGTEMQQASCLMSLAVGYDRAGDARGVVENVRKALAICEQNPNATKHIRFSGKTLLQKYDASEQCELSGEEFASRLNEDDNFRLRFRDNPVRLVAQHGLTNLDVLELLSKYKSKNMEDLKAVQRLLQEVVEMQTK